MTILGANHAQITVPTLQEADARRFYRDFLGLEEIEKPTSLRARGGFWLQAGAIQLHIGLEDHVDRAASKAHVAYEVTDLAAWRARLTDAGYTILEGIPIPGFERFEFRDPFGNRVEIMQRS